MKLRVFLAMITGALMVACAGMGGVTIPPQAFDCRGPLVRCPDGQTCGPLDDGTVYGCRATPPPPASPSPVPTAEPAPSPEPTPTAAPSPSPVPSPVITPAPTPKPPKPCKIVESELPCWTCKTRMEYDVRNGHFAWDPASKRWYGDSPGNPRVWIDQKCNKVDAAGNVQYTAHQWFGTYPENGQGFCPVEMLTCPATPAPPPPASPTPTPSTPPTSPVPPGEAPEILPASGNYPVPDAGTCPAHFKDAVARVGVSVPSYNPAKNLFGTPCQDGPNCRRFTIWATQKSLPPFCEHSCYDANGQYSLANCRRECETWRPCQEPQFVDYLNVSDEGHGGGVLIQIRSAAFDPPWNTTWGRADKQTCSDKERPAGMTNCVHNFNAHDKAKNRPGITEVRACMPDETKCSETTYRTDGR